MSIGWEMSVMPQMLAPPPSDRLASDQSPSQPMPSGASPAAVVDANNPPAWVLPIRWHLALFGLGIVAPPVFVVGYLVGDAIPFGPHDLAAICVALTVVGCAAVTYGRFLALAHKTIQIQVQDLTQLGAFTSLQLPKFSPVREANETMLALAQAGRHISARTASLRVSEERFRGLVDDAPVGIFRTDEQGSYTYVNARWTAIVGSTPDQLLGDAWMDFVHTDDRNRVLASWKQALIARAPFVGEYRCITPDGRTIWVNCHAIAETDDADIYPGGGSGSGPQAITTGGYIGTLTNITERRQAEIARDEVEDQLRHAIEVGRMGIWEIDLISGIGRWDAYLYRMFGLEPHSEPITPALLQRHVVAEDLARLQASIAQVAKTREPAMQEFRITRPDGEQRWLVSRGNVIATHQGLSARMAGVTFDITDAKRQEEKQALLIGELSHRVKNTLAVLQAIAFRSLRTDDTAEQFVARFTGRLSALADAHSLLTDTDWDGTTLRALITQETSAAEWRDQRVSLSGPDVLLKPEAALALALVFHELTTNAIKYGALAGAAGQLDITWAIKSSATSEANNRRQLMLTWNEQCGMPISPVRPRGFGSDLIERSLGQGLGGTVERTFGSHGVTVKMSLPLG
jgi:PAS domain S-box-containing protein